MGYEIRFPMITNDDQCLTCVVCGYVSHPEERSETRCAFAIAIKGPRRRVWSGIHRTCAKPFMVQHDPHVLCVVDGGEVEVKLTKIEDDLFEEKRTKLPLTDEDDTPKL